MNAGVPHSLPYRREIDGLRGVAVLLVLCYHAGMTKLRGGFVGVDVFFVISGFLITQVILKGLRAGTFTFGGFYLRRVRRIFPALFAMLLVCSAIAVVLFPPSELRNFGLALSRVAEFVANNWFAGHRQTGYFESAQRPSFLLQTWSLSLEEQFYVVYPLLLVLVFRFARRWMLPVLLSVFAASLAVCLWWTAHSPIQAFYLLPSRAWELLAGSLLAVAGLKQLRERILREAIAAAGLAMIACAAMRFGEGTAFPGYAAMLPAGGSVMVLWASEGESVAGAVLRSRPLAGVGLISYSLYLWHWPIFFLVKYVPCTPYSSAMWPWTTCVAMGATVVMAVLSYWFVERPFRVRGTIVTDRRLVPLAAGVVALTVALGWGIVRTHGLIERFPVPTRDLLADNHMLRYDAGPWPECSNYGRKLERADDAIFCSFGDVPRNVFLVGDSHAMQMLSLLVKMREDGKLQGRGVVTALAGGCPPVQHINNPHPDFYCDRFTELAWRRAQAPDIDTVYVQFSPWWTYDGAVCESQDSVCRRSLSEEEIRRIVTAGLMADIELLKAEGKRVVLGLPFPVFEQDIPDLQGRVLILGRLSPVQTPDLRPDVWRGRLIEIARKEGIATFDPRATLCHEGVCLYQSGGLSLLRDNAHLAATRTGFLAASLGRALNGTPSDAVYPDKVEAKH